MINTLQSLRGVFAIMVFLSHFVINEAGDRVYYDGGPMGVEYFIVLSGFVLCAGYELRIEKSKINYKNFMLRRLIRIYPLHLGSFLLWAVVAYKFTDYLASEILPNLFLIQSWFPDQYVFYGCNTPSWCLSTLLFCYLMFPLMIRFYERRPRLFIALWGVLMVGYVVFLSTEAWRMDEGDQAWLTRVIPPVRLLDFVLGMLLWQLFASLRKTDFAAKMRAWSYAAKTAAECLPVVLYLMAAYVASGLSYTWVSQSVWWIPTLAAILVFSLLDKAGGVLSRLFDSKALVAFGNASFCFYLLHMPVIGGLHRSLVFIGIDLDNAQLFVATLLTTAVVSMLVSRYLDLPLGRWLKTKLLPGKKN